METREIARVKPSASLKDILGIADANRGVDRKWKRHFHHLSELRERILEHRERMAKSAKEEQSTYSLHMADAGTDQYDCDFALSMVSADQNALYEIDEALNRIRNGSYGICELSGQPIEEERLEVLPWTRFSAAAQRELEENGAVEFVKFGKRRSASHQADADVEEEEDEDE